MVWFFVAPKVGAIGGSKTGGLEFVGLRVEFVADAGAGLRTRSNED